MTGDLNNTFGNRFICNCSEAATTTLNPEPFLLLSLYNVWYNSIASYVYRISW